MAEITLKDVLISALLVGGIAFALTNFLGEQANNFNVVVDTSYADTFNHTTEFTNTTENIRQSIETGSIVSADGFAILFNGAVSVFLLIINIIFLPLQIFADIIVLTGAPAWVGTIVIAGFVIVVLFMIMNAILGRGKA